MKTVVIATLAALLMAAPLSFADHPSREDQGCDGDKQRPDGCICPDYTIYNTFQTPDGDGDGSPDDTYYTAIDEVASHGYLFSIWIFLESNGVADLQRHDDYCTDEAEYTDADRDEIIF